MNGAHVSTDEIVDYLHGELPVERDAAVAMHLAQCRTCSDARDEEIAVTEMVRAVAQTTERTLPYALDSSILAAAQQQRQSSGRFAWLTRPALALPAAIAAVVLIWAGTRSFGLNPPKATIAASDLVTHHAMFTGIAPFADDAPIPAAFASDNEAH